MNKDLEHEIIEYAQQMSTISKRMAEEVDWEVISTMLCQMGWTEIKIKELTNPLMAIRLTRWVKNNCQGKVRNRYGHYVFELEQDAMFFALRWA